MKRITSLALILALILLFCGCGASGEPYTVTRNGIDFLVNAQEGTIQEGDHTYDYVFSGDSEAYRMTITYPNGSTYWWDQSGLVGSGGWSDDYDENTYQAGNTLREVLVEKAPRGINSGKLMAAIFLLVLSILNILFPRASWYLGYGWRYKNAEPSDGALIMSRIGGAAGVVIGMILLLG